MKRVLALNSHSLSAFQQCETKYLYSQVLNIEPLGTKLAMDKGSLYARFLEIYYYNKIRGPRKSFTKALFNSPLWIHKIVKKLEISRDEAFKLHQSMFQYIGQYANETWIPIAAERGFSKILYEDDEVQYIYEGRPDLIVTDGSKLIVVDHKTQGKEYSFYEHNNQAIGYMWNYEASHFVYNYIKLLSNSTEFRRESFAFSQSQISQWRADTLQWFKRIDRAILDTSFLPSYQCEASRFGTCGFTKICQQPSPEKKFWMVKSQYLKKKPYRSW